MKSVKLIAYICILLFTLSCNTRDNNLVGDKAKSSLTVFAAAGTRTAIEEISTLVSEKDSCKVEANYASSGTLARQIANGAECDVYISANKQWIDYLLEKNILDKNSVRVIAKSSLVIVCPTDHQVNLPAFSPDQSFIPEINLKIAVGNPDFVPVGKYAKMVFDTLGWYENIKPNLVMCKDVSSVRHYVELGECDWGIVYYTEAIQSEKLQIVSEIPEGLYQSINFYVALINSGNRFSGEKYIDFLTDSVGQGVIQKYGFTAIVE